MHARRIRPDTGPTDRRRLAAAGLSAVLPGLGQAFNRRRRLALWFLVPSLILLVVAFARHPTPVADPPRRLGHRPGRSSSTLLLLNLVVLAWRLIAVGQAFLDTRPAGPTGRLGIVGHRAHRALAVASRISSSGSYGSLLGDMFERSSAARC